MQFFGKGKYTNSFRICKILFDICKLPIIKSHSFFCQRCTFSDNSPIFVSKCSDDNITWICFIYYLKKSKRIKFLIVEFNGRVCYICPRPSGESWAVPTQIVMMVSERHSDFTMRKFLYYRLYLFGCHFESAKLFDFLNKNIYIIRTHIFRTGKRRYIPTHFTSAY